MNRYIDQLVEEIQEIASRQRGRKNAHELIESEDEREFNPADVEKFVYGEQVPLGEIVGLPQLMLPPAEKLTEEQRILIVNELDAMLQQFNFCLEPPANVPEQMLYKPIPEVWAEEFVLMDTGMVHIELCSYNPDNCPFQGYCSTCDEF